MISEISPRGKPSMTASSEASPVGRIFRILDSGRNPSVTDRAAFGFMQFRLLFAIDIVTLKGRDVKEVLGVKWHQQLAHLILKKRYDRR